MLRIVPVLFVISALAMLVYATGAARAGDPLPARTTPAPVDLRNTICPVSGSPVTPGVTAVVNGAIVHFCCPKCPAKYEANPGAYASALRADPAVAARIDAAAAAATSAGVDPAPGSPSTSATVSDPKGAAFHDAMRTLWSDHVTWTRLFVVSATGDLADKDAVTARLLKNQEDIGNALEPIYGAEAGTKLTTLLKAHITTAAELVAATIAGESTKVDAAATKWSTNADEIATFLSAANPKAWPLPDAKSMMQDHLAATTAMVKARVAKDWDADIAAFEKVREQAMHMADMLSDGVRGQFPEKFK